MLLDIIGGLIMLAMFMLFTSLTIGLIVYNLPDFFEKIHEYKEAWKGFRGNNDR